MEFVEQIFLVLAYVAVIGFLINGLDDLFFDVGFLRYLLRTRNEPHLKIQDLKLAPEQWIALFVPAWQEGGIVNRMAEYASRVCVYERYDIFIGVYPNDPETNQCVDRLCDVNTRIHKVVVPHPGPTSKADCLNWIFKAMRLNEIAGVREYKVIGLHDAEDVLHPLVLKVYNYFIPRQYDMGQVPVFALELPVLNHWIGNTYVDDFSELHTKDLFVREKMGGVVPSAGVGTCFSRAALDRLAADNNDDPFRVGNLTEDYEVAIRIKRAGLRGGVLNVPVDRVVRHKRRDGSLGSPKTVTEVIAIREAFPATLIGAIRQRSRWIMGISFQTWEQTGWAGTLPMRYTLLRDRRAPLTHLINIIGYLILLFVLFQGLLRRSSWTETLYLRPLFTPDSVLWKIAIIDTWLLVYRALQKMLAVYLVYNFKQAVFSVPRVVVGNVINFIATVRAIKAYLAHKLFGKPIVWLKTNHVFPPESELAEYTKTIEDLLIEEGLVTQEQIVRALKLERGGSAPLSLLRMGLLDENQFTSIWVKHSGLATRLIDPDQIPISILERFDESKSLKHQAIPAAEIEQRLQMVFREPPTSTDLANLSRELRMTLEPFLGLPSSIVFARNRAYRRLLLPPSRLARLAERIRRDGNADEALLLRTAPDQELTQQALIDLVIDKGFLKIADARNFWAECLGCPPFESADTVVNKEWVEKAEAGFWWLHRMLPVDSGRIITASPIHPELKSWLVSTFRSEIRFEAELPRRLELAARAGGLEIDPDSLLLDHLAKKNILSRDQLAKISALRQLTTDPAPNWLLLHRMASEEQLHRAFLDICNLPSAEGCDEIEVKRLSPLFAPGFAAENGCYPLAVTGEAVRLGLSQMPSPATLRQIHHRLAGYPLFFQALSFGDAQKLKGRRS